MISAEDFLKSNPIRLPETGEPEPGAPAQDGDGDSSDQGNRIDSQESVRTRFKRKGRRAYPVHQPKAGGFGASDMAAKEVRPDADSVDACREAALTLLDASARSSGTLAQRLSNKGFTGPTIEQVITRLTQLGLLDDRRYAQDLLRSCLHRTMGERGALNEMTRKGLDRSLSEDVIARAAEEGLFVDSAYELGRRVAKRTEGLAPDVRRRRLWGAGSRKGHNPSLLTQVANDLLADSDTDV